MDADTELAVRSIVVPVHPTIEWTLGGWTLCTDDAFLTKIRSLRRSKLPNETGGVLIGSFDLERRIIYLVDTIPSPPDSKEWPTLYIRGSSGLSREVKRIGERTAGMLQYIGEWHSHPRGCVLSNASQHASSPGSDLPPSHPQLVPPTPPPGLANAVSATWEAVFPRL